MCNQASSVRRLGRGSAQPVYLLLLFLAAVSMPFMNTAFGHPVNLQGENVIDDDRVTEAVAFGDIDGDGDDDVVYVLRTQNAAVGTPARFRLEWRQNPGWAVQYGIEWLSLTPTALPGFSGNDMVNDIVVGDIVTGGLPEVIVCSNLDGTFWFGNTGAAFTGVNGTPRPTQFVYAGDGNQGVQNYPNARKIAVGNIDNSGGLDVVTAIAESGNAAVNGANTGSEIVLSIGNGAGGFTNTRNANWRAPNVLNIHSVTLANLAGGAGLEAIVCSDGTNSVHWFLHGDAVGGGWGTVLNVGAAGAHPEARDAAAADFNGDGFRDIVTVDQSTDQVRVYLGNGTTGAANFQGAPIVLDTRAGGDPQYVQAVDFDDDGDVDVLVTFRTSTELVYYDNNGAASFTARVYNAATVGAPIQANPLDFNARVARRIQPDDPWIDLVVASENGVDVSFYQNLTYNQAPTYTKVEVSNGDLNTSQFQVTFSKAVAVAGATNPATYTISGPGLGTAAGLTITSAGPANDVYNFTYATGSFVDGANITVLVAVPRNITDADGVPIAQTGGVLDGAHLVGTLTRTATNRLTNSIPSNTGIAGTFRAYNTDTSLSITAVPGGGPAQGTQTFRWLRNGVQVNNGGSGESTVTGATTATITVGKNYVDGDVGGDGDVWTCLVSDDRPEEVDASITLRTAAPLDISPDPTNQTRDNGQNLDLDAPPGPWATATTGGFGPIVFQWQFSVDNIAPYTDLANVAPYSGVTTADLVIAPLFQTEKGFYRLRARDDFFVATGGAGGFSATKGQHISEVAQLNVINTIDILTHPAGGLFYTGNNHSLTVTFQGGDGPFLFEWLKGGAPAPGGPPNAATWNKTGLVPGDTGLYSVRITDQGPSASVRTSNEADVQVANPVSITLHPLPVTRNSATGSSQTFTVTATGGHTPLTYQWQFDDPGPGGFVPLANVGVVSGADTPTLTINPIAQVHEGQYRCVVTDIQNGLVAGSQATSNAATMIVWDPIIIDTHPQDVSDWPANGATFQVTLSSGENVTYIWQFSFNNLSYTDLPASPGIYSGQSTDTLVFNTPVAAFAEGFYRIRMTNPVTTGLGVISNPAQLTLFDNPAITQHPVNQSSFLGNPNPVVFTAAASGDGILFYQWQADFGAGYVDLAESPKYVGTMTTTLSVNNTVFTDSVPYRMRVTNNNPIPPAPLFTNSATMIFVDPIITSDPVDDTRNPGETASFTVTGAGTPDLGIQWQRSATGNPPWIDLSDGATGNGSTINGSFATSGTAAISSTINILNVQENDEGFYRAVLRNKTQTPLLSTSVISEPAELSVNDPPTITLHPQSQSPDLTTTFMLSVAANGGGLTFAWEFDPAGGPNVFSPIVNGSLGGTVSIVSGPGDSVLTISNASDVVHDGRYRAVVTNGAGSATSNIAIITVINTPPSILTHPADIVVPVGGTNSTSVTAAGSPVLQYQWQFSTSQGGPYVALTEGVDGWTGVNTPTLTVSNAQVIPNEGYVRVLVNNTTPIVATSNPAYVLVGDPLIVTQHPQSRIEYVDAPFFYLTVDVAGGRGPRVVEWFKDDVAVPSSNTFALLVDPPSVGVGTFQYNAEIVDDRNIPAVSNDGTVQIVNHLSKPFITPNPANAAPGSNFTFTANVSGGKPPLTYQWLKDDGLGGKALQSISGENDPTLVFSPVEGTDAGFYAVTVMDSGTDDETSDPVELVIGDAVPAAGAIGLLTLISALGGALAIRRRK